MKLRPLQQWICDTCGNVIASPQDGWLEWVEDDERRAHDFNIVHHKPKSPRPGFEGCYQHSSDIRRKDMHLEQFLGPDGLVRLLSFLELREVDPNETCPRVKSHSELAELIRRLMLPGYEEARLYWSAAEEAGFFSGSNEVWPYLQSTLDLMIETYGSENVCECD